MSYERVVVATLGNVAVQTTDVVLRVNGSSVNGTFTQASNPLSGEKFWNSSALVVTTGVVSGTWTVELQGTVAGVTGLPLARRASITATGTTSLANLCNSPAIPTPTQVLFDNTSAGGITTTVACLAKTYRGKLRGNKTSSYNVLEGQMSSVSGNFPGSGVNGITGSDKTHILAANSTSTNPSVWAGLDKYHFWDAVNYYANVTGISGTYIINILGQMNGNTVTIATTPSMTGVTKVAFTNTFFGPSPRPSAINFDFSGTVGANGLTATVVFIAKSNRGQRWKN